MSGTRITVNLSQDEARALLLLAETERRHPRDQAALILRQELERLGFVEPVISSMSTSNDQEVEKHVQ